MQTVTVAKAFLIDKLTANRQKHVADFADAMNGYWDELKRIAVLTAARVERRDVDVLESLNALDMLDRPKDHSAEYDCILEMLACELSDKVILSAGDFNKFVRDEWHWRGEFMNSVVFYTGGAGGASGKGGLVRIR